MNFGVHIKVPSKIKNVTKIEFVAVNAVGMVNAQNRSKVTIFLKTAKEFIYYY